MHGYKTVFSLLELSVVGNVIYFIQSDRLGRRCIVTGHGWSVSAPTSALLSVS
jgi:hypothetical protein